MTTTKTTQLTIRKLDENRIAEEIVRVLPAGVARAVSHDRDSIRFTVRAEGLKLRDIVFRRDSLRRLIEDPARNVKIEYLQRDLLANAQCRGEFRYPRENRIATLLATAKKVRLALPIGAAV